VALEITNEIKINLTPQEQASFASAHPVNPDAYEAHLKGRYYAARFTSDGLEKATGILSPGYDHRSGIHPYLGKGQLDCNV
jgi:hypothetical protein